MPHANAPLTELGRLRLARCVVDDGWPLHRAAERFQVSPVTAKRWADRYRSEGPAGMHDRFSRPHHSPNRTPRPIERKVLHLRRSKRLGPARIGWRLGLPASTCHAILRRAGQPRLVHLDRGTREPIRRYEYEHAGDLIHVDVKKLGNIPDGGGHRTQGRAQGKLNRTATPGHDTDAYGGARLGYAFLHTAPSYTPRLPTHRPGPDCAKRRTTRGWPTPKSWPTRPKRPPPGSGGEHTPGSPATASRSPECSPTTDPATNRGYGRRPAPSSE